MKECRKMTEMTEAEAIALLRQNIEKANRNEYVRNKIAWALYQTWKEADRRVSE